ncbi:MAG: hypothetical protein DYG94_00070 [Leptolyngbya sp. PLA3]|nr:MAG: hypothetical protein EDM82_01805 [Cyanobacteria bacterium CYA]MCE7967132.1 hypothetical protein [Leptolyngbya sp. PL-A3]
MAAVFGLAHADELRELRRRGYEAMIMEPDTVELLFGAYPDHYGTDMHFVMIVVPRAVSEIVLGSELKWRDDDGPNLKFVRE